MGIHALQIMTVFKEVALKEHVNIVVRTTKVNVMDHHAIKIQIANHTHVNQVIVHFVLIRYKDNIVIACHVNKIVIAFRAHAQTYYVLIALIYLLTFVTKPYVIAMEIALLDVA
jgi:hypothetical protein